jgi:hypothetical protein
MPSQMSCVTKWKPPQYASTAGPEVQDAGVILETLAHMGEGLLEIAAGVEA